MQKSVFRVSSIDNLIILCIAAAFSMTICRS